MQTKCHWRIISVAAWVLALAGGAGYLGAHGARQGEAGVTPARFDDAAGTMERTPGAWTIVLAVHPRCPCTRASADELIRVLAGAAEPWEVVVLAFRPVEGDASYSTDFSDTATVRRLASLEGVRIIPDPDGRLAARFGALTSGHALVYDLAGHLRYAGGLTPSRAHIGPNTGSAALSALLRGGAAVASASPVFGCPLDNTTAARAVVLGGCAADGEHTCTP